MSEWQGHLLSCPRTVWPAKNKIVPTLTFLKHFQNFIVKDLWQRCVEWSWVARKQRKIVTSQQPFLKTRQVSSIKTSSTKLLLSLKDNFARSKTQKTPQRKGYAHYREVTTLAKQYFLNIKFLSKYLKPFKVHHEISTGSERSCSLPRANLTFETKMNALETIYE